ncbi:MAG: hypothetical protein QGG40_11900 [Myxococcota bacterium]|nr:hypothetical protein [Myxococcota bacterium]
MIRLLAIISFGIQVGVAHAEPVEIAPPPAESDLELYEALLGEAPVAPIASVPDEVKTSEPVELQVSGARNELESGGIPWWGWCLGLGALSALYLVQGRNIKEGKAATAMKIAGRVQLDKESRLVVLEVMDGLGSVRRLVVGHGGGAPRLVADLGAVDSEMTQAPKPDATLFNLRSSPRPVPSVSETSSRPAVQVKSGRDLVAEVLLERTEQNADVEDLSDADRSDEMEPAQASARAACNRFERELRRFGS